MTSFTHLPVKLNEKMMESLKLLLTGWIHILLSEETSEANFVHSGAFEMSALKELSKQKKCRIDSLFLRR